MIFRKKPRGYVGINHETIGSDILSVFRVVSMPEVTLGPDFTKRLRAVQPNEWYPIEQLLELLEVLEAKLGRSAVTQMGRKLFEMSHAERVRGQIKTAAELVYGLNDLYHHANRGKSIGGWQVLSFEPGKARLEKTTPHLCVLEEGIVTQALLSIDVPSLVTQEQCLATGAECCIFSISSISPPDKWGVRRASR